VGMHVYSGIYMYMLGGCKGLYVRTWHAHALTYMHMPVRTLCTCTHAYPPQLLDIITRVVGDPSVCVSALAAHRVAHVLLHQLIIILRRENAPRTHAPHELSAEGTSRSDEGCAEAIVVFMLAVAAEREYAEYLAASGVVPALCRGFELWEEGGRRDGERIYTKEGERQGIHRVWCVAVKLVATLLHTLVFVEVCMHSCGGVWRGCFYCMDVVCACGVVVAGVC